MALLEGETPRNPAVREELSGADRRAAIVAGAGACLTLAAIVGLPGPDAWFMGLAPALGLLGCGAALLGMFMERFRGGWARLLLSAVAAALAISGLAYLRSASATRVILAYLVPAVLLFSAAGVLHAPRIRARAT